jgi:hypothetical protein
MDPLGQSTVLPTSSGIRLNPLGNRVDAASFFDIPWENQPVNRGFPGLGYDVKKIVTGQRHDGFRICV